MVLRMFWNSLGLILGALWGLLGTILGLQIDRKGLPRSGPFSLWALGSLFGLFLLLLATDDVFNLLLESLGVNVDLPGWLSDFHPDKITTFCENPRV